MFSETNAGRTRQQHTFSAAPATASRTQALEPYSTLPISLSYPESSQRTRLHDVQLNSSHEGRSTAHLTNNSHVVLSGAEFSPVPPPSDRPPPPDSARAPHSFTNRFSRQIHPASTQNHPTQSSSSSTRLPHSFPDHFYPAPNGNAQPSSSFHRPFDNSYRELSTDGDELTHPRFHHHPSNFIPIVPTAGSSANYRAQPHLFDASEPGSPQSSPSLSPPPPIETIASPGDRKSSPARMHVCEICGKEFPRPSGLRTHMNIHNHLRPYPCGFPGCPKMFSVRSNARRHFRIHNETTPPPPPPPPSGVQVEWGQVKIMPEPPPPPPHSLSQAPFRFRWAPHKPNLYSRTVLGAEDGGGGTSNSDAGPSTHDANDMYDDAQSPWDARYSASDE